MQQGIAAHNAGNLQEAENAYRTILQSQPKHPDANHNLGLIAISANQIEAALALFKIALDVNPNIEQFWISYIDALVRNQQLDEAERTIDVAADAAGSNVCSDDTSLRDVIVDLIPFLALL